MLRKKTQPEANNDKILISVKEACELTGLSEKTMRSLMNENCFMVRIGRRTLIDKKIYIQCHALSSERMVVLWAKT